MEHKSSETETLHYCETWDTCDMFEAASCDMMWHTPPCHDVMSGVTRGSYLQLCLSYVCLLVMTTIGRKYLSPVSPEKLLISHVWCWYISTYNVSAYLTCCLLEKFLCLLIWKLKTRTNPPTSMSTCPFYTQECCLLMSIVWRINIWTDE